MQGFIGRIAKEAVVMEVTGQGSAFDGIRVKDEGMPLWLERSRTVFDIDHLSGTDEDEGTFLVVVVVAAVAEVTAFEIFEKNGIYAEVHSLTNLCGYFGEIYHIDEWVRCIKVIKMIVLCYGVKLRHAGKGTGILVGITGIGISVGNAGNGPLYKIIRYANETIRWAAGVSIRTGLYGDGVCIWRA